jgi:hypothetical protein
MASREKGQRASEIRIITPTFAVHLEGIDHQADLISAMQRCATASPQATRGPRVAAPRDCLRARVNKLRSSGIIKLTVRRSAAGRGAVGGVATDMPWALTFRAAASGSRSFWLCARASAWRALRDLDPRPAFGMGLVLLQRGPHAIPPATKPLGTGYHKASAALSNPRRTVHHSSCLLGAPTTQRQPHCTET